MLKAVFAWRHALTRPRFSNVIVMTRIGSNDCCLVLPIRLRLEQRAAPARHPVKQDGNGIACCNDHGTKAGKDVALAKVEDCNDRLAMPGRQTRTPGLLLPAGFGGPCRVRGQTAARDPATRCHRHRAILRGWPGHHASPCAANKHPGRWQAACRTSARILAGTEADRCP